MQRHFRLHAGGRHHVYMGVLLLLMLLLLLL
jgi:hypothetical protein